MKRDLPQALFLDRDGTLIKWIDYLHDPEKVVLGPGITRALWKAKRAGCRLFMHTNQSGVGRGYFPLSAAHAVNERMFRLMGVEEDFFDGICIAPDDPDRLEDPSYRKPNPRFEREMIEKYGLDRSVCYMIGDRLSDVETGMQAGINCVGICENEACDEFQGSDASLFASVAMFVEGHFP